MTAYDAGLTRTLPGSLSYGAYDLAAVAVGDYALFGGGSGYVDTVNAYDENLTRTIPTGLSSGRTRLAAAAVGGYALFGGGTCGTKSYNTSAAVDAYAA